jgi:hypothetical protein
MIITGVTGSAFESLRAQLSAANQAQITGTTNGVISGHGVTANYAYDGSAETLTVDVVHHPFFIPVSAIESQLRAALAGNQTTR